MKNVNIIEKVICVLDKEGPLTGKELYSHICIDELTLWRSCCTSETIVTKIFGKRYLRLDKHIEGYARLSPSIMREFLSYSVIGMEKDTEEIYRKAEILHERIKNISKKKFKLAYDTILKLVESSKYMEELKRKACFIIAGDVVYEMAHTELRPESSSGELVKGSDLDIIVVTDDLTESIIKDIDLSMYREKSYLIKNPSFKEEIDYVIKDISKVRNQIMFKGFESMIASKILNEGEFLYGSRENFDIIKSMLIEKDIPEKLSILEKEAIDNREKAYKYLLKEENGLFQEEAMKFFFTKEESEEIF